MNMEIYNEDEILNDIVDTVLEFSEEIFKERLDDFLGNEPFFPDPFEMSQIKNIFDLEMSNFKRTLKQNLEEEIETIVSSLTDTIKQNVLELHDEIYTAEELSDDDVWKSAPSAAEPVPEPKSEDTGPVKENVNWGFEEIEYV